MNMAMQQQLSMTPNGSALAPAALQALTDVLLAERKLIDELTDVVLRQRKAVGVDDLDGVDDSVFATHRLLITLGEARKRRRSINAMLGCAEDLAVKQLDEALGPQMTPAIRAARESLQTAARKLSKEIEINRRVLKDALANGDSFVRAMVGAPKQSAPAGYRPGQQAAYTRGDAVAISRTA